VDLSTLDRFTLNNLLVIMLRIRLFEEALFRAFMTEKMPGTMHQTTGQEAIAAGISQVLQSGDVMTSTHRGHGHAIAKGVSLNQMMAEMYARTTGVSAGMGGSMHMFDLDRGFLGTTGVVGAGLPIAVGAALALKLDGKANIAVAFFGEGAANQGAVHEALNMAAVWKLPVLFVCENNHYAVSTGFERSFAIERVAERAPGYGMPGLTVDGNDVLAVYTAADQAVTRARNGEGPYFLECITYRHKGHSRFEPASYRSKDELETWLKKDPIERYKQLLASEGIFSDEELQGIGEKVRDEIQQALEYAHHSPLVEAGPALALAFRKPVGER